MERIVKQKIQGFRTQDGAGVNLVRVLSHDTMEEYDPILMLDSFDSTNPDEYIAGFPMHPHRGIETISYVYSGKMTHKDSLGNEDTIGDGEVQWMTAGSGILHEEKLPASDRLLGVQLWLNLPSDKKMVDPEYCAVKNHEIPELVLEEGKVRVLAGSYGDVVGHQSKYLPLDYYDLHLNQGAKLSIPTDMNRSIMIFTLMGEVRVGEELISEKTAAKLTEGDHVTITAVANHTQVLFISSSRLGEPIAWGGPIVMNTKEELQQAYYEIRQGTFIRKRIDY